MATSSPEKSLCFFETIIAKQHGEITNDEYYHYIFDHLAGKTHEDNIGNCTGEDRRLNRRDLFVDLVQGLAKKMERVDGTSYIPCPHRRSRVSKIVLQIRLLSSSSSKLITPAP